MSTSHKAKLIILVFALCLIDFSVTAKQSQIDLSAMNRDIKVMAGILSSEFSSNSALEIYTSRQVTGSYIQNYGAVFFAPLRAKLFRGDEALKAKDSYDSVLNSFTEILRDYGDVLEHAKPTDKFIIICEPSKTAYFNSYDILIVDNGKKARFAPEPFVIMTDFETINKLNRGRLNAEKFKARVRFEKFGSNENSYISKDMNREIKIMRSILDALLEEDFGMRIGNEDIKSAYLEGYGVLFNIRASRSRFMSIDSETIEIDPNTFDKNKVKTEINVSDFKGSLAKINYELGKYGIPVNFFVDDKQLFEVNEAAVTKAIDKLTEAIGEYGSKLKSLQPNDKIAIQFSATDYRFGSGMDTRLLHESTFKDLKAYSDGRITLDNLKSKVVVHRK